MDCFSAVGPLGASMGVVCIQIKKQMGSVGEDYRRELRFISQGASSSMSDDMCKGLGSL